MSTTLPRTRVPSRAAPVLGRETATGRARLRVPDLLWFAKPRPFLAALALTLLYLGALAALVATLAASAMGTPLGTAAVAFYAAVVLVYIAVGVFTVLPERASPLRGQ